MDIIPSIKRYIIECASQFINSQDILKQITLVAPKDSLRGDLATNAAMIIANATGQSPQEVGLTMRQSLLQMPHIAHVELAGPGFINIVVKSKAWQEVVSSILTGKEKYGQNNIGKGMKVNVEYVSANPTGPLHIGHTRGAIYGDALARMLEYTGYIVDREFYINDAGGQVKDLGSSVFLRYQSIINGHDIEIPQGLYPGEYLIPIAQALINKHGVSLQEKDMDIIINFAIQQIMQSIKDDLHDIDVCHSTFFSEQSLHKANKIAEAVSILENKGFIYHGTIPEPKGKQHNNWICKEQILFRSTAFGDDQDRPLKKENGDWTYFAAEIAYIKDKIDRGYNYIVIVLGADHSGYVKRLSAVAQALNPSVRCEVKVCQVVNYIENGLPVKMSKRSGTFTTIRDVIDVVDKNIIRFMMLTKKNDSIINFDLAKVKEQSKDNPVFYVQYAHVRTSSIIKTAKMQLNCDLLASKDIDYSLLNNEEEILIMRKMCFWPMVIETAEGEPHKIISFMEDLSHSFHALWNLGKENNDYRFIITDNLEITAARLALAQAINYVLKSGFGILGINPLDKM